MMEIFNKTYRIATRTDGRQIVSAKDMPGSNRRGFWQRLNRPTIDVDLSKL